MQKRPLGIVLLAGVLFVASLVGMLVFWLFPASFLVPGGQALLPSLVGVTLIAWLGYRFLRRSDVGSAQRRSS